MFLAPPGICSIFDWLQFASCPVSYCILSRPPPCWLLAVKLKGLPVISARPIWDKSPSADLQISSLGNISLQTSLKKSGERLPFAGFWPSSGLQVLPRSYLSRTTLGQVSWCRRYPASNNVCKHVLNLRFISCIMVWTSFCFDPSMKVLYRLNKIQSINNRNLADQNHQESTYDYSRADISACKLW